MVGDFALAAFFIYYFVNRYRSGKMPLSHISMATRGVPSLFNEMLPKRGAFRVFYWLNISLSQWVLED